MGGLADVLKSGRALQRSSELGEVFEVLHLLWARDDEVGIAANALMHAILGCTEPEGRYCCMVISNATMAALEAYARRFSGDQQVQIWLRKYREASPP